MKTPWINHEEMKRISITRQTVFFFTVVREQYKSPSDDSKNEGSSETDSSHHELDAPHSAANTDEINNSNDSSDENQALDLHRKNDDCKETGVCQVVKKIKEIQTDLVDDKRSLPIDYFTEGSYFNKITDFVSLKQVHQTDVTHETDNNLQSKSRFNFEYISEFDLSSSYIEPVKAFNALEKLASTRILEPSKKRGQSIKFGISQLVNVLKKLQTIHTNDPFELSIAHTLPIIDEAAEIDHVIDSQSECEPVLISIADAPLGNIEVDKSNSSLEDTDKSVVIELDEENSESKQMGMYRLVNTLKRVQTIHTEDSLELSTDNNFSVVDEATEIDHMNDLQTEYEPVHISTADALLGNIELDKSNSSLEDIDKPVVIELDEENRESKQMGIYRLVNTLKRVQTIRTSLELSTGNNIPVIDEAIEIDYVNDLQTECEPVHNSTADILLGNIEVDKSNSSLEDTDKSVVIELDEENRESKQMGIYRLVNTLKSVQAIRTGDSLELSTGNNIPVIDEATEIDYVNDLQTECEPVHNSTADILLGNIEVDKSNSSLEDTDKSVVIELDEENSESKQMGMYRLVNTLKRVQTIHTEDSLELSTDNNFSVSVVDEATEIDHMNDLQTECEPVHISTADAPLSNIELDKSNSSLEDIDKPVVIELDEENRESKQTECEFEPMFTSESGCIDNVNEEIVRDDANKIELTEEMDEFPQCGKIYCKTIKSPFSTIAEIDDFLHAPLFGEVSQNTFEFLDPSNKQNLQLDTKFISTSTYYPQKPSCHLVSTSIHEIIYITNTLHTNETKKNKSNNFKSNMIPIHPSPKTGESNYANDTHDFIKIRVPVVVGEYNIEICIEEEISFEEEAIRIKEVSKNVVLTNCHFTPTQLSKPLGDGTCVASNGVLSIEGLIVQNIEYSAMADKNKSSIQRKEVINLHEKVTLELMVQLLQEQGIRVHYNDLKNYRNGSTKND